MLPGNVTQALLPDPQVRVTSSKIGFEPKVLSRLVVWQHKDFGAGPKDGATSSNQKMPRPPLLSVSPCTTLLDPIGLGYFKGSIPFFPTKHGKAAWCGYLSRLVA